MLSVIAMSSCNHKLLDDGNDLVRVRVEFDWTDAPDANPKGMSVFFYESTTDRYERFDFPGTTGGYVNLPLGTWHVIAYNNDYTGVTVNNAHKFYDHFFFTRDGNVLEGALGNGLPIPPRAAEEERVTITPDMMWGDTRENHILKVADGEEEAVVTMKPRELCAVYSFEIRNVENLSHVAKMCASLSGMASGLTLHGEILDKEPSTLALSAYPADATTIAGQFYTFGHHADNTSPHRMTLYVWMDDGRKLAYGVSASDKWDVTDQIHSAANPKRVHYIIDGLDIPTPMPSGMFDASADDWFSEEYELGI